MSTSTPGEAMAGRPLLQIAPMMEVSYRDFRNFMRLLTRRAQLWTEMVVDDTLLHNLEPAKCDRFLGYSSTEHPVVCQLGGSDPQKLAQAAEVVERYKYDEVNLNVGCPSDRVAHRGEFGCSLMRKKEVVRDIIHSMSRAVQIPVTVKCRLGFDNQDSLEFTRDFVRTVAQGGCKHFIIHARKAWLNGLSPAQNRSVPPLHYTRILELCREFPDLKFSLNGGIVDVGHARALLGFPGARLPGETDDSISHAWGWKTEQGTFDGIPSNFQGVMIGRGAMNNPAMLWDVDQTIYGDPEAPTRMTRRKLLNDYCAYLAEAHPETDVDRSVGSVHLATKPTLGLFSGLRGNKAFRMAMDSLMRVKENRMLGPAHTLAEAMKALDSANPGLLDEPLQRTEAYKPGKTRVDWGGSGNTGQDGPEGSVPCATATPRDNKRGRKRKCNDEPQAQSETVAEASTTSPKEAKLDVTCGSMDPDPATSTLAAPAVVVA